jgi:hypothetical protein
VVFFVRSSTSVAEFRSFWGTPDPWEAVAVRLFLLNFGQT